MNKKTKIAIFLALFAGAYNAIRGHGIKFFAQKPIQLILTAAIGYYFNSWWGLALALPVGFWFTETGDIMAAFSGQNSKRRKFGVGYGTLTGCVFVLPFFATDNVEYGLPLVLLGLICGALRKSKSRWNWRGIELFYFIAYVYLYYLAV